MPSPTMMKHSLVYFLATAAFAASPLAFAGAGQTSAGVTTTGAVDPTAATQNVQSQSSNFVQENQGTQNGAPISSVAGTAASKTGAAGTAQGGDASNTTGKPGDPNNPNGDAKAGGAQASAPVVPAAPPPDYVSNVKKVTRDPATTDVAVVDTATTGGAKTSSLPASPEAAAANSAAAANVVGAPGIQRQAAPATPRVARAADTAKVNAADRTPQQTGAGGGSGSTPDSYAFYIGIIIAGALLAFAAATFFRSDNGAAK